MTTAITNIRTRQQWAEIINADWRKSIDSIIQTGRDLAAAKDELSHGDFVALVEHDLPFGPRTAQQLMAVSKDERITKTNSSSLLPASWRVLSALTSLSDADFKTGVETGIISPDTSLRAADAYAGVSKVPVGETWGAERKPSTLPTPDEARKIARETGRFVAASDSKIYSGATAEEASGYAVKRDAAFDIIEAIETLGNAPAAESWFAAAERHWFHDFRYSAIDDAIEWLTALKAEMGVVDA
jgi:hypothetical protein